MKTIVILLCLLAPVFTLHAADIFVVVVRNDLPELKYMVKNNRELLNSKNHKRESLMHIACQYGHLNIVKYLLLEGLNPNETDKQGKNALHHACSVNNVQLVKLLCARNTKINKVDTNSDTPLHIALTRGFEDVIDCLIRHKADVLLAVGRKESPLAVAIENSNEHIVGLFLKYVKNPSQTFKNNPDLIESALKNKNHNTFSVIYKHLEIENFSTTRDGESILHLCIKHKNIQHIKTLVNDGVDLNWQNKNGETPLYVAAVAKYFKGVDILLENGADMYIETKKGLPVVYAAVRGSTTPVLISMLQNNFDVNKQYSNGKTALHYAVKSGEFTAVHLLLENKANMNAVDSDGYSPLTIALMNKEAYIAEQLTDRGAKVFGPMYKLAADEFKYKRRENGLKYLRQFKKGGDSHYEFELYTMLVRKGDLEALEILKSHGVDMNKDVIQRHPLLMALESQRMTFIDLPRWLDLGWNVKDVDMSDPVLPIIMRTAQQLRFNPSVQYSNQPNIDKGLAHSELMKITVHFLKNNWIAKERANSSYITDALNFNDLILADILYSHGVKLAQSKEKLTYLFRNICRSNDTDKVKWVMERAVKSFKPEELLGQFALFGKPEHMKMVKGMISFDLDAVDQYGNSAVNLAVKGANIEMVKWFLDNKANPNVVTTDSRTTRMYSTPLISAITKGNHKLVSLLLDKGADPNVYGLMGQAPLNVAVYRKDVNSLMLLLKAGANVNAQRQKESRYDHSKGYSALHQIAADSSSTNQDRVDQMIKILLDAGIDTALVDSRGETAAELAKSRNNLLRLKMFAAHGLGVDQGFMHLSTAKDFIKRKQYDQLEALLKKHPELGKTILASSRTKKVRTEHEGWRTINELDNLKILKVIFEAYPNGINEMREFKQHSLFMDSIINAKKEMFDMMLEFDPDPKIRDKRGWTAMHHAEFAAERHQVGRDMLSALMEKGFKRTGITKNHWQLYHLLHIRTERGDEKVKADILKNWDSFSNWPQIFDHPLRLLLTTNNLDLFAYMLENGMSPNAVSNDGSPIVFSVLNYRRASFFNAMLEHGLDIKIKSSTGLSIFEHLQKRRSPQFIAEINKILIDNNKSPLTDLTEAGNFPPFMHGSYYWLGTERNGKRHISSRKKDKPLFVINDSGIGFHDASNDQVNMYSACSEAAVTYAAGKVAKVRCIFKKSENGEVFKIEEYSYSDPKYVVQTIYELVDGELKPRAVKTILIFESE